MEPMITGQCLTKKHKYKSMSNIHQVQVFCYMWKFLLYNYDNNNKDRTFIKWRASCSPLFISNSKSRKSFRKNLTFFLLTFFKEWKANTDHFQAFLMKLKPWAMNEKVYKARHFEWGIFYVNISKNFGRNINFGYFPSNLSHFAMHLGQVRGS